MPWRSKPTAVLSIILVLAGALGGWHTPDDVDDHAFRTNHETRLISPAERTAPEHCALCHWLQAMGKAAPPSSQATAVDSFRVIGTAWSLDHVHTTVPLSLPSRAPPLA